MAESFLSLHNYTGGKILPKGCYAVEFQTKLHTATKADGTPGVTRLGVMGNFHPITEEGAAAGDAIEQFFSLGSKAHLNFVPNEDGTGFDRIEGTTGTLTNKSNFAYFLKSLIDCGCPEGDNDISYLNGVWIRTDNVPAPEDRKSFQSNTSEADFDSSNRGPDLIVTAIEVLDGGKPWEGSGGIPEAGGKAKKGAAAKPGSKAVAKPASAAKAAPKTAAKKAPAEDYREMVETAISDVLTNLSSGGPRLRVRTEVFKALKAASDEATAKAALEAVFDDAEALSNIVEGLGFSFEGGAIKPAA